MSENTLAGSGAWFTEHTVESAPPGSRRLMVATRNGCQICVAMHTARRTALGADEHLIAALRDAGPLSTFA
jgi:AhpD family alkylhydroperoxidase